MFIVYRSVYIHKHTVYKICAVRRKLSFVYLSFPCEMCCPLEASTNKNHDFYRGLNVSVWLRLTVLLIGRRNVGLIEGNMLEVKEINIWWIDCPCVRGYCVLILRTLYYVAIRRVYIYIHIYIYSYIYNESVKYVSN
jgi:hypothetical protein